MLEVFMAADYLHWAPVPVSLGALPSPPIPPIFGG